MAKRKHVVGTITGESGEETYVGGSTGVFPPRQIHVVSGKGKLHLTLEAAPERLKRLIQDATLEAQSIFQKYLGDDWGQKRKRLDTLFLTTGIERLSYEGKRIRIDPINFELRSSHSQQEIEQLLDADSVLMKVWLVRDNPMELPAEGRIAHAIELGVLWQQMKLRDVEADAVRGKITVESAVAGGKAAAKLTDEQKRMIRLAAEEAKLLGKKLTAVDARFAKEFSVSAKTIERARKEKPADNPANV